MEGPSGAGVRTALYSRKDVYQMPFPPSPPAASSLCEVRISEKGGPTEQERWRETTFSF